MLATAGGPSPPGMPPPRGGGCLGVWGAGLGVRVCNEHPWGF